jgi:hypothetical protein
LAALGTIGVKRCGYGKIQVFAESVEARMNFGQAGTIFEDKLLATMMRKIRQRNATQRNEAEIVLLNETSIGACTCCGVVDGFTEQGNIVM